MPFLSFPLASPLGATVDVPITDTTHATAALSRLAAQFQGKPNITGLITALCGPVQTAEDALQTLLTLPSIDDSFGVQLDTIGKIISQPRHGLDDATYRLWLKARVLLNKGSGTPEDIYAIFAQVLPSNTFRLVNYPPASFMLDVLGNAVDPALVTSLLHILQAAADAGIRGVLHWFQGAPQTGSFCFLGGSGLGFDGGIWSNAE